jgi:hypothetical protein
MTVITPYQADRAEYTPDIFSVCDIETDAQNHNALIAMVLSWRNKKGAFVVHRFMSWDDFLDFLKAHPTNKYLRRIYAHNGGGYDWLHFLSEWIRERRGVDNFRIIRDGSGKVILIVLKMGKRGSVKLVDSLKLLPASLAELAREFRVTNKLTDGVDDTQMKSLYDNNPDIFWKRVETDTTILIEILEKFGQELFGLVPYDELPLTAGSASMLYFRHKLKRSIYTPWGKALKDLSRRSYYGGRVETFKQGEFRAVGFDVNSMYPAVMVDFDYPLGYQGVWSEQFKTGGLYEVVYTQGNKMVPAYLRDEITRTYSYSGRGVYWFWDLEKLVQLGGTFEILQGYVFRFWGPLFYDAQTELYAVRNKYKMLGEKGRERVVKLLMNSLYGKFGQRAEGHEVVTMGKAEALRRIEAGENITYAGDGLFMLTTEIKVEHEFAALASAVTSRARAKLFQYMEAAGQDLIYVDTDSVKVLERSAEKFTPFVSLKLGDLKEEWRGVGAFVQNKLYAGCPDGGRPFVVSKGVPPRLLTYEIIRALATDNMEQYRVDWLSPTTLNEVLSGKQGGEFVPRHRAISKSKRLVEDENTLYCIDTPPG